MCRKQKNGPSKDIHVLIPRTCDDAAFHGKKDFADMTKLRRLGRGDDPESIIEASPV